MSADNWVICPYCKANADKELQKKVDHVADSYGKVTLFDWNEMNERLREAQSEELEKTFREDYEIGVSSDGTFEVDYRGSCINCRLQFTYKHEQQVK